jgi:putative sterol carrier protein
VLMRRATVDGHVLSFRRSRKIVMFFCSGNLHFTRTTTKEILKFQMISVASLITPHFCLKFFEALA